MQTNNFYFDLPEELIAQHPSGVRGCDKLMRLDRKSGNVTHFAMADLPSLIQPGTVMVFNNSKVRRSRVYAKSVGKLSLFVENNPEQKEVEFLFLNVIVSPSSEPGFLWKAMVKNARRQKPDKKFLFSDGTEGIIEDFPDLAHTEFRVVRFSRKITEEWFEKNGHIPLPPYIKRNDIEDDSERYQTVYAKETGSAAAPTAGLHFTEPVLDALQKNGVEITYVTLHVGLGTFLPVRTENIEDHKMHEEFFHISAETAAVIEKAHAEGRPILAVGTTSMRTLESAWNKETNRVKTGTQSTSIFIYPGYTFSVVNKLFTNFHTPESTLLMLVSAFAGREHVLNAYQTAIENRYRFFSYGDAMLID